jgi:predicted flap endonuclease-1-like 5' DNA nuclease
MKMANLTTVEGIGEAQKAKLTAAGITTTQALLERGKTPRGRDELAQATGISEKLILNWVNRVDLFRVQGIGSEYADLLEEAGVDTVPELAQRNPEHLHATMAETNQAKHLVRQMPSAKQVANWVSQAKELPREIVY